MATIHGTTSNDTLYGGASDDALYGSQGDDTLYSGLGNDIVEGGAGNDTLYGGNGNDTVEGGAGNDTLYGGGESDTFVAEFKFGDDVIDDFDQTKDLVSLRSANVTSFADVQARMSDIGGSTLIIFDDGSTLTIKGKVPGELSTSNFSIGSPICYTPGALIATPDGPIAVEALKVGDLVTTADAGMQPIRWIGRTEHAWPGTDDKHKPIQIKAGALGSGLPRRDMAVSPQHRMLIAGAEVRALFGCNEVLALAKGLTGLPGVRVMKGKKQVTYISLLLDRHQVLIAEGARSESFYPGPTALQMLPGPQRAEVETIFPRLRDEPDTGYGPPARPVLTRRETETLVNALLDQSQEHAKWDEDLDAERRTPPLSIVA